MKRSNGRDEKPSALIRAGWVSFGISIILTVAYAAGLY